VHPSGKFLYVSNRGHDSIANYTIGDDGKLTPRGLPLRRVRCRATSHRARGRVLLAANQKTDSIVVFKIDQSTGDLTADRIEDRNAASHLHPFPAADEVG
jgi:6-phosphogluconolactonase